MLTSPVDISMSLIRDLKLICTIILNFWMRDSLAPSFTLSLTCDQASPYFQCGKERLIQILDYLSVASPESELFSDWSRNKRHLEQNEISVSLAWY